MSERDWSMRPVPCDPDGLVHQWMDAAEAEIYRLQSELQSLREQTEWVSVDERLPPEGVKIDLCAEGIVQDETFSLEQHDIDTCGDELGRTIYVWYSELAEESFPVTGDHLWRCRPLPPPPEQKP